MDVPDEEPRMMHPLLFSPFAILIAGLVACAFPLPAVAIAQGDVQVVVQAQNQPGRGGPPPGQPPQPGQPGQPPGGPNASKPGEKTPGQPDANPNAPAAPADSVKRTDKPPEPPNKKEFDVRPDDKGMVEFQFRNQAWPDILRWVAETSNLSLDWQELPNDYLNIATQRKQSLEDTRDLINRHLLARGYTMLELDGVIQVVKTAGINVSLVPRVPPAVLEALPPNRFVRTSFSLTTLLAKDVVEEFKPLVSSNGTLNALEATNRLEAMDSASNLAEIARIIQEEESDEAAESLAREFELEFVRAVDAREQLMSFLGIEQKGGNRPMNPMEMQMQQQQMQMRMQMQQQQAASGGKVNQPKEAAPVYLIANMRRNSIIAHAAPDKMAIIAAFIKRIDVPSENSMSMQRLETRMKVYRLSSLDPKQLVASMIAMDALEPTTRLEVDDKNRAIIAYASLGDQLLIQQTIDRLDGSARDFEVIQLRRLNAEDVAGTIKFLMGSEQPKDDSRNRNRYYYDPWGYNQPQEKESTDAFRVGANSQDNQILLWANEIEIKEVNKLLMKLGEIPPQGQARSTIRTIDASRSQETKEYLERLREAWSKVSPQPLVLPGDEEFQSDEPELNLIEEEDKKEEAEKDPDASKSDASKSDTSKSDAEKKESEEERKERQTSASEISLDRTFENEPSSIPAGRLSAATVQEDSDEEKTASKEQSKDVTSGGGTEATGKGKPKSTSANDPLAGIEIRFDEKGNLVIASDDLDALDRLEEMMMTNSPPQRKYEVFYIQHTRPSWIELNLKDYFKDEDEPKSNSNSFYSWLYGFDEPSKKEKSDPQLGKKRKLKFISDLDTRSLIVIGADEQQLKTIKSLIKLWDVPEKPNRQKLRFTKLVKVEHSRADSIVDAIKEAYRDLLSANDKAFSKGKGEGNQESKHEDTSESVSDSGGMSFRFTGRLSMGIDRVTNSIIVSAEGEDLLKLVVDMIKELDVAAQPSGAVQMVEVGGTNSVAMERALKALIGRKEESKPPQPGNQQGGEVQQNNNDRPPSNNRNSSQRRNRQSSND